MILPIFDAIFFFISFRRFSLYAFSMVSLFRRRRFFRHDTPVFASFDFSAAISPMPMLSLIRLRRFHFSPAADFHILFSSRLHFIDIDDYYDAPSLPFSILRLFSPILFSLLFDDATPLLPPHYRFLIFRC
jgi:hypothetical protein